METILAARKIVHRLLTVLIMVSGLTMGVASFAVGSKTEAACGPPEIICGCFTTMVRCISGCSAPNSCIWEIGHCTEEIPGIGYPACGFTFCSEICGVLP